MGFVPLSSDDIPDPAYPFDLFDPSYHFWTGCYYTIQKGVIPRDLGVLFLFRLSQKTPFQPKVERYKPKNFVKLGSIVYSLCFKL